MMEKDAGGGWIFRMLLSEDTATHFDILQHTAPHCNIRQQLRPSWDLKILSQDCTVVLTVAVC